MANDKSIDGLVTHRSQISKRVSSAKPKSRTPSAVTGIVKPTPSAKPATKPKSTKLTVKSQPAKAAEPKKIAKSNVNTSTADHTLELIESIRTQSDGGATKPSASTSTPASAKPDQEPKAPTKTTQTQTVDDFLSPVQAFNLSEGGELTISETSVKDMKAKNQKAKTTKTSPESKKAKTTKKKPSSARRIITTIILIIVLGAIGLVLWAVFWGNDIIAKITGGQGNVFDLLSLADEHYDPLKTDSNGRTNILAFGTSGFNMDGDEGDGKHDGAQLTDSIMIISLNQNTGDMAMLNLPRDLKASPTCTATSKINEVYWCNDISGDNEEAGAAALMTEVGSILGIEFQYYAHLNWGSLVSIVDTLGGIKVTLDENIQDYYYTEAVFEAGVEYEINGEQALGLARARHGTTGGDFSRGASQQKILIGIKNKVFEKNLSLTDLLNLASTLGDNLRTNFSISEFKTLAHLTYDFDFDSMRQLSLLDPANNIRLMTTSTINGISYVIPSAGVGNYGAIQDYVKEQLSNDPLVREDATILVLNASDVAGLASSEQKKLETEGHKHITADNAPEAEYPSGTTLYAVGNKPGTKAILEEYYQESAKDVTALPEVVPLNYDFIIILNPTAKTE